MIYVNPDKLTVYGLTRRSKFFLIIDKNFENVIKITDSKLYQSTHILTINQFTEIDDILTTTIQNDADIFLLPYGINQRWFIKQASIPSNVAALTMLCHSTYVTEDEINHFLEDTYNSDPEAQTKFSERYFTILKQLPNDNQKLLIKNTYGSLEASYLIDANTKFSEQSGYVKPGKQLLVPNGEIAIVHQSLLKDTTGYNVGMQFNGKIILDGAPIIHKSAPEPYVNRRNLDDLYARFNDLAENPLILTIVGGVIESIETLHNNPSKAKRIFESLFEVDSRFRIISEIGCSFNSALRLYPTNSAFNESYGGEYGCIHFGIGSRHTLYHMDFLSPCTYIQTESNEILIGHP